MKFVEFVLDAGGKVEIPAIPAAQNDFASAEAAAQLALDAEVRTTNQINDLMTLAIDEKNYAAQNFLQWFVNEQVEEIATASTNLDVIKKAGLNVLMVEAYLAHINEPTTKRALNTGPDHRSGPVLFFSRSAHLPGLSPSFGRLTPVKSVLQLSHMK
jgi:hypothetical protein